MTVYLDSSALIAACIDTAARPLVIETLKADPDWCTSALTLSEAVALVGRLTDDEVLQVELEDSLRVLWDRIAVVPIDITCLNVATELARDQNIRISDAIHLAAAMRLPLPLTFVTIDPKQIPLVSMLPFRLVTP